MDRAADELVTQLTGEAPPPASQQKGIEAHPLCIYFFGDYGMGSSRANSTKVYTGTLGGADYSNTLEKVHAGGAREGSAGIGGRYFIRDWLMLDIFASLLGGYSSDAQFDLKTSGPFEYIDPETTKNYRSTFNETFSGGTTINYVRNLSNRLTAFGGLGVALAYCIFSEEQNSEISTNYSKSNKTVT